MGLFFYAGIISLAMCVVELIIGRSLALSWDFFPRRSEDKFAYWRDVIVHFLLGIIFLTLWWLEY